MCINLLNATLYCMILNILVTVQDRNHPPAPRARAVKRKSTKHGHTTRLTEHGPAPPSPSVVMHRTKRTYKRSYKSIIFMKMPCGLSPHTRVEQHQIHRLGTVSRNNLHEDLNMFLHPWFRCCSEYKQLFGSHKL